MRTRSKLIIAAIAAIALLGMTVSTASAGRLSLTNGERGFRLVWTPLTFEAAGATVRCNVTLEGSFSVRSIVKRAGTGIGAVTRGGLASCAGGTARVNTETMPWSNTYQSFRGTLPRIEGVVLDLVGATFEVDPSGALPNCRAVTERSEPGRGIANVNTTTGEITSLRAEEASTIGTSGGFLCEFGTRGRFIGTANATVLGESARTVVRLI